MKRILSILLVLVMLCSFGTVFAQEKAPAEEPVEQAVEVTAEEPAEEAVEPAAEETVSAEETPVEETVEEIPKEEITEEEIQAEAPAEEAAEEPDAEPVADGDAYSGTFGDDLTWSLDSSTGALTISGTGAMPGYGDSSSWPWYNYGSSVKSVTILEGVTSIGHNAFRYYENLTSVTIPSSVTSIDGYAFRGCSSLTNVTIQSGNATMEIENYAFCGCSSLTSITLNRVRCIDEYAFEYCSSLTNVTIPSSLRDIGNYAFSYCDSGLTIEYGGTKAAWHSLADNVSGLGDLNVRCTDGLIGVVWSYADGVLTISGEEPIPNYSYSSSQPWYSVSSSITSVVIEEGVTSIGSYAFGSCSSLTSVTIPDSVTSIGHEAFKYCSSLTSVTIQEGVQSIGYEAFYDCSSLTSVTIPSSVTSIDSNAFHGCSSLTGVYISSVENWCEIDFGNGFSNPLYYAGNLYLNGKLVTALTIPSSVTSIGDYAFYNCSSLTSVTIPSSVTSIGTNAFYNCSGLTSVTIPSSVTSINGVFTGCTSLTDIYFGGSSSDWENVGCIISGCVVHCSDKNVDASIGSGTCGDNLTWSLNASTGVLTISGTGAMVNGDNGPGGDSSLPWYDYTSMIKSIVIGSGVTSIGTYTFKSCSNLKSVTIPSTVTSIGSGAFWYCSSLTSVTISNGVTSIGSYAFGSCSSLTRVTIPDSVTSIGNCAFDSCSSLTNVTIGSGVTEIGSYAFEYCKKLTGITIPDSVETIGYKAFYYCTALAKATIGSGVTYIGGCAFEHCALTTINIPGNVTEIGEYAFYECSSLTDVYYAGSETDKNNITIGSNNTYLTNATWHYTETATTLASGKTYTAQITSAGGKAYYEFTPTSSNTYVIYSTGSSDTRVALYDASGTLLATNDNSGEGNNFRLAYAMTAGTTYRYAVYYRSSSATGSISFTFGRVYTIKYNANGGSGAPAAQIKDYGTAMTISGTVPTRSGYTFLGWSATSTATAATYTAGASYTANGNTTLYAVWKQNTATLSSGRTCTAQITAGGSKAYYEFTPTASNTYVIYSTGSEDTRVALYDASGTLLATNDNSGEGNNFRLAYAMTAGTTYRYAVYYRSSSATGSISFTFGRVYTIKYNANGGSGVPAAQTKDYGMAMTISGTVPTRSGYTFLGWAATSTATAATYTAGASYTANGNTTLYAVWQQDTATLSSGRTCTAQITAGGSKAYYDFTPTASNTYVIYSTGSADTRVALYDASGTLLATNDNSGEGNNFRLAYAMTAGTTYRYAVYYRSSAATGSISFTFGRVYTIRYNANGGSGAPTAQTHDYGTTLTLSSTKPTRSGYTFLGWAANSTATTATYKAGGSYTANGNVTLYAVWKAK